MRMLQKNWVLLRSTMKEWDAEGKEEIPVGERWALPERRVGILYLMCLIAHQPPLFKEIWHKQTNKKGEWGTSVTLEIHNALHPPKAFKGK